MEAFIGPAAAQHVQRLPVNAFDFMKHIQKPFSLLLPGMLCSLTACLLFSSCAMRTAYYQNVNGLVSSAKYADAATLAEKERDKVYGEKNALLYYMDRGMFLHLSGDYADSNRMFEEAKRIAADRYTKSITAEASTFLISDNMRAYAGEDFERALIHVFSALNYLLLGQENEALVEARQADHFLTTLQVNYGARTVYKEDAFVRYLMGMLYENQGQLNDAFISYRQALDAYTAYEKNYGVAAPKELVSDALRVGRSLGFRDEVAEIERTWGTTVISPLSPDSGELVVLDYNGFSAEKTDYFFEISFGKAWLYVNGVNVQGREAEQVEKANAIARSILADEQVRLAFPKYMRVPGAIQSFTVTAASATAVQGQIVENVSAIAEKSLDDRIARIRIKTIARAAIKFALSHKIVQQVEQQSGNEALAWLAKRAMNVASSATEHADLRSWRSLPDTIGMARLLLPEGTQNVRLSFHDQHNAEIEIRNIDNIKISRGKKTFIVVRTAQ